MNATLQSVQSSISPELESRTDLLAHVEYVNGLLTDVLGPSLNTAAVHWDVAHDERGRALLTMRLKDEVTGSEETAAFALREFSDEWRLRHRLYETWGDLLERRSERAMQELREAVRRLDDA
ncbi:MAG: hypothetical protein DWQ29_17795 [Planctomycetota bacterium]|nr:MAG: hypothetical protein DWQ29_17795 [Planctomycetota bacterium]